MTFAEEVWQHRLLLLKVARYDEDLVHDTIVAALTHEQSFRPGSNLAAWLVTILKNRRSTLNKKYRREVPALEYDPRYVDPVGTAALEAREALESVPQEKILPLIMTHLLGHSYNDVAKELGVNVGTIKSRIHRAARQINESV